MLHHHTRTPYHPQSNGIVEAFNKVFENARTKVCNTTRDDWDEHVPPMLWEYKTTKQITQHTPSRLMYGKEAIMSMEFLIPNLNVPLMTKMLEEGTLK